jgi:thymidylate kinase
MKQSKIVWRLAFLGVGLLLCLYFAGHHAPRRALVVGMSFPMVLLFSGIRARDAVESHHQQTVPMAPLIAIVGCDGAGKSTLAADMHDALGADHRVETCYLGLGSGEIGNRIKQWPLIGPVIEHKLASKAAQTRTKGERIPGVLTALVVFGFSLLRLRRFRRVLALRQQGVVVITDRYPQTEIAGFYDGPGLSAARAGGPFVAWLAERERRLYLWMAEYKPDVVIRLNIDAATAFARKPDHKLALLRQKVEVTPLLRFNGARIVDLDSREAYAVVRDQTLENVQQVVHRAARRGLVAA